MNDFPVDFQTVAKGGDQLKPLSSSDLMRNFAWAKLQADPTLVDEVSSMGFTAFKLKIPPVPSGGTYVLGAVDGALSWIATEECP
jgi:hypothetical protein